jgi:AcrR family transcriptional regulator
MLYFINAANKIIDEEGIQAVTIRSVSDLAGYTSATLYNYFDNLDHVIILATMNYLEPYSKEILRKIKGLTDPIEIYQTAYDTFVKHTFKHPDIFALLFFANPDEKLEEYAAQYFSLFPEKLPGDSAVATAAARRSNIRKRNMVYLEACVNAGVMTPETAEELNDWAIIIFKYYLEEVRDGKLSRDEACEQVHRYRHKLFELYRGNGINA